MKKYFILVSFLVFFLLWLSSDLTVLESVSVVLFVFSFLELIYDLGKRVIILDFAVQAAIFTCLVMPVIFYHVYTPENHLARLWIKYMPISSDEYFTFALPAVITMTIGIRIPLQKLRFDKSPGMYMQKARDYLVDKPNLGFYLIAIGLASGLLDFLASESLKQVFFFMAHLTYVGVFYVLYSPYKHKKLIVTGVLALMVGQTIVEGMFGEFIYLLACSLTLILLGKKLTFRTKMGYACLGIFLIILLQSIKVDYRKRNWIEGEGADPVYFAQLIGNKITDVGSLVNADNLFFTSVRMNQGWLVAVTMKRVPERFSFSYGETIAQSIAATIVPRFVWPDKPDVGGKANLRRFWGFNLAGYSMNLGPLGEAYANFDKLGGIVYMFFYGLFFNFMMTSIVKFSEKRPTVILWLPFLFFYSISVESDLLTTMGALVKGLIFAWIVFKIFNIGFRVSL
ncbi:MAG TPA: hypothetical protein VK622_06665 [Puia sp.]|nr:hypothetical protein [Puia sp.]